MVRLLGQRTHGSLRLAVRVIRDAGEELVAVDEGHDLIEVIERLLLDRGQVLWLFRPFLELSEDELHAGQVLSIQTEEEPLVVELTAI